MDYNQEIQGRRGNHHNFRETAGWQSGDNRPQTHWQQQQQSQYNPYLEYHIAPSPVSRPRDCCSGRVPYQPPFDPRYSPESQMIRRSQEPYFNGNRQTLEIPPYEYHKQRPEPVQGRRAQLPVENLTNSELAYELAFGKLTPKVNTALRGLYQAPDGPMQVARAVREINHQLASMSSPFRLDLKARGQSYEGKEMLEITYHGLEPYKIFLR